jgi:hypothetical protein
MLISRRQFFCVSTVAACGLFVEKTFAAAFSGKPSLVSASQNPSPTQTPSPSPAASPSPEASPTSTPTPNPTPTPAPVPNKPSAPFLAGDDQLARAANFLMVRWLPVAGAERFELKIVTSLGTRVLETSSETITVDSLEPNLTHDLAVRAINNAGESPWSNSFMTCTRPPTPTAPQVASVDMIGIPQAVDLQWNLALFVEHTNDGANLKVDLALVNTAGTQEIVVANRALIDRVPISTQQVGRNFLLRLTGSNPHAPGGLNHSQWSGGSVLAAMVFGELRVPTVAETHLLSTNILRGYYGHP